MADEIVPVRACTKCGETKPLTNEYFAKQKTARSGLASQCKACTNAYAKAWRKADPGRAHEVYKRCRAKNIEKVRAADKARYIKRREYCVEKSREWRRENPERAAQASKIWIANNAERVKEYRKNYNAQNREQRNAYFKNWYAQNREWAIAYAAARRAENPERDRAYARAWYENNIERATAYRMAWRRANPEKHRIYHENRRARKMGGKGKLSPGLVHKLFKLQRGKCACCGAPLTKYHLDHIVPLALGGAHEDSNMQLLTPKCNMKKGAKSPEEFARARGLLI